MDESDANTAWWYSRQQSLPSSRLQAPFRYDAVMEEVSLSEGYARRRVSPTNPNHPTISRHNVDGSGM